MVRRLKHLRAVGVLLAALYCFNLTGCATIGSLGTGLSTGLITIVTTAVTLPLKVLSKILDIVNKLPTPPPGVF